MQSSEGSVSNMSLMFRDIGYAVKEKTLLPDLKSPCHVCSLSNQISDYWAAWFDTVQTNKFGLCDDIGFVENILDNEHILLHVQLLNAYWIGNEAAPVTCFPFSFAEARQETAPIFLHRIPTGYDIVEFPGFRAISRYELVWDLHCVGSPLLDNYFFKEVQVNPHGLFADFDEALNFIMRFEPAEYPFRSIARIHAMERSQDGGLRSLECRNHV
jgi:hypothetical protein